MSGLDIYDYSSNSMGGNCDRATLPILGDWSVMFSGSTGDAVGNSNNDGEGSTPKNIVELAEGAKLYNGAMIRNKSCKPIRVDFTVIHGEDCNDECTPVDVLQAEVVSVFVDAKSGKRIDIGFWQKADVVVLDVNGTAGTPTDIVEVGVNVNVEVDTAYRPACPSCVKFGIPLV